MQPPSPPPGCCNYSQFESAVFHWFSYMLWHLWIVCEIITPLSSALHFSEPPHTHHAINLLLSVETFWCNSAKNQSPGGLLKSWLDEEKKVRERPPIHRSIICSQTAVAVGSGSPGVPLILQQPGEPGPPSTWLKILFAMMGEQLNDFLMVMHEDSVGTVCCSHFAVVTRNRNRVVQYLWIVCTPAYPTTSALLQMCNDTSRARCNVWFMMQRQKCTWL